MFRYRYFIRKTVVPYNSYASVFKCIRVPEGDARIPKLTETYKPIGWDLFIEYPYKPTTEAEIFQLKMKFQGWDSQVEIEDIDAVEKKTQMY